MYEQDEKSSARGSARGGQRGRRPPPRLSAAGLERQALRHLDRYPSSVENLRRVLGRRADRSCDHHGDDRGDAESMIAAVLEKLVSRGLLDDRSYAAAQARRMRARGASGRRISVRLHEKGVPAEIARSVLDDESHAREEADLAAARTYARLRRLGPHRLDPAEREARRQRDLAALARAGFGYSTAVEVIDASPEDARFDAPTP